MTDREKDILIATGMVGKDKEYIKSAWLEFASAYGWDGAWCSETACSISYLAGNLGKIRVSNYAEGLMKKFKAWGRWGKEPQPGAFIIFGYDGEPDHAGRVIAVNNNFITTVEGNISGRVVKRTWYKDVAYIIGYGYPAYEDKELEDDMTKAQASVLQTIQSIELHRGDTDNPELINWWQNYLNEKGYYHGTLNDGDFGTYMEKAVIRWQKANGLYVDGWIGKNSWAKALED